LGSGLNPDSLRSYFYIAEALDGDAKDFFEEEIEPVIDASEIKYTDPYDGEGDGQDPSKNGGVLSYDRSVGLDR
jgi:hypothetical protein